ncbi:NAD(+)/NADH kinase [Candidatus Mancarchaeum acidiphilum]|nr:NAD(+)/NADH kinase [Candidatus Mancarchaeum acidiphilum]
MKRVKKVFINAKRDYKEISLIKANFETVESPDEKADICISIGGDGTFIESSRMFNGPILPINGLEKGSASYYSDIDLSSMETAIKMLKKGDYKVVELSNKIKVTYKNKSYYAINEALLRNYSGNVYFELYMKLRGKRERLYPYVMAGDGMLITSTIGSTAYNMSANGPIILDEGTMCLTFLNASGPFKNSIIVNSGATIYAKVAKYKGILKSDEKTIATLSKGDEFSVSLSDNALKVVKFNGLYETFSEKLEKLIKSRMLEKF